MRARRERTGGYGVIRTRQPAEARYRRRDRGYLSCHPQRQAGCSTLRMGPSSVTSPHIVPIAGRMANHTSGEQQVRAASPTLNTAVQPDWARSLSQAPASGRAWPRTACAPETTRGTASGGCRAYIDVAAENVEAIRGTAAVDLFVEDVPAGGMWPLSNGGQLGRAYRRLVLSRVCTSSR